jgi:hypothetical protein
MGWFDFLRRPGADRDQVAIEIDVAAGVLQRCPVCKDIADKLRDDRLPAAELLVHQRFDHADPSVAIFQGDRRDLLRRLRSVRDRFEFNCSCEKAG